MLKFSKKYTALLLMVFVCSYSYGQVVAQFEVDAGKVNRNNSLVSVNLENITTLSNSEILLVEVKNKVRTEVPKQISQDGSGRKLWWIMEGETKAGSRRKYELVKAVPTKLEFNIKSEVQDSAVVIYQEDKPVLKYYFKTVYPPQGIDPAYRRSGFIHPVWSPSGAVLTKIQPKDHYHHYGIWNPWTKTVFEGDTVDFWNIGSKQATVKFNSFASIYNGSVFGGFTSTHEHLVYKNNDSTTALFEEIDVRVIDRSSTESDVYLWDFTSTLSCAGNSPITLKEYRYGGFGYRATEEWTKENSKILTSEGVDRKKADGSTARWVFVSGATPNGTSGILFMGYPTNYNFPEPIRVWPEDANRNRGDVFINFSPTKNKDWHLKPGNQYVLKYRMLVFDGELSAQEAESYWQDFSSPPIVTVIKANL